MRLPLGQSDAAPRPEKMPPLRATTVLPSLQCLRASCSQKRAGTPPAARSAHLLGTSTGADRQNTLGRLVQKPPVLPPHRSRSTNRQGREGGDHGTENGTQHPYASTWQL